MKIEEIQVGQLYWCHSTMGVSRLRVIGKDESIVVARGFCGWPDKYLAAAVICAAKPWWHVWR